MIRPQKLNPGDTIGIITPSWGGAGFFPHRTQRGVQKLKSMGYEIIIGEHALNIFGFISDSPENRAADIHSMFLNSQVKAIIASIGGNHSNHLLPLLDFDLIKANPKIFIGFSDITVLNVAIWQKTGMITFNGPALLTDFAEYPEMPVYTQEYFLKTVSNTNPPGSIKPSTWWTEEFLDWEKKLDLTRPRESIPSSGWVWLKPGKTSGQLVGGCLGSMQHLRGTPYWPDLNDKILFLETSEEKPGPATVDATLMDYQNMGVFDQISGLILGRPMYYSPEEKKELLDILINRTLKFDFPIIADMDFGHTSPQFTLPIGCQASIDSAKKEFCILEPAVC
ncbi:MAG: LD-carboxypeptidase [Anaerolineaceae bacterium]|nr:LD-carboxypeptidase [Anaerolineaceae bacterium]